MRKQQRGSFTTAAAGTLCVLTLVSVGLTDRAQATDEAKSVMPKSDETKETTNKDTAKKDVVKKQSERQPRIIFAKHTIIWEGTEVLSREQTIARLAEWRKNGKVRPKIYMTNGFSIVDNALNDQVDRVPIEVVGQDQWALMTFVQGVRNQKFDSVKTQADLDQPSGAMVRGRVLLPSGEPGSGTQLVLLQKGRWGNLSFNGRTFVDPVSEQCTNTRADGNFELHVGADDYYVAMLHRDGYLVTRGPLTDGTDHTLKAWQTVTVTTAGWKDDQHAEVWVRVEGTAEPCPGWSMKWITRKDQTVEVKVPVGNGRIAQLYSNHGAGAAVGNIAFEVSPDPQQVLSIPPLTEIQRVAGKTKLTEWLSE